jgi:hypothetical protein
MTNVNLQQALTDNKKTTSTIAFAQDIEKTHGNVLLNISVDELLDIYQRLLDEAQPDSKHFSFLKKGLSNYSDAKFKGQMVRHLHPHIAHYLHTICGELDIDVPVWMPETFKIENHPSAVHNYMYLFNWSTVNAAYIDDRHVRFFELKLNGMLREKAMASVSTPAAPALSDNKQLKALKGTLKNTPTAKAKLSLPSKSTNDEVASETTNVKPLPTRHDNSTSLLAMTEDATIQHQLLTSMKYISLFKSATSRNKIFTLSLDDVARLLRERRCHYTGEVLSTEYYEGDTPPDNHLSVDRVDNNLGYEPGNVVACAHWINKMKDRMSAEEFEQVLMMRKLMQTSGMSSEATELLAKMSQKAG